MNDRPSDWPSNGPSGSATGQSAGSLATQPFHDVDVHDVDLSDDRLAAIAKALAHPARIALVRALARTPACCGHLVKDLKQRDRALAQSTVSQHLSVLVEAGLVRRQVCGVESHYTLDHDAHQRALRALGRLAGLVSAQTSAPHTSDGLGGAGAKQKVSN